MIFNRIKKRLIKEYRQLRQLRRKLSNTYYVSLGENCLTDNILDRFNLKSFSTPYSHGRSNIDYAIHLEKEKYCNLLAPKYLYYDYLGVTKVVRNKHYSKADKIFNESHLNGFEFTHHDVIGNKHHRDSYKRKALRMCAINNSKKVKFLYHYRINEKQDFALLISKAKEFLNFYQKRNIQAELIFFTQEVVSSKEKRALLKIYDSGKIKGYVLKTLETWAGNDQDVFWAKKDDDLLLKMIKEIK